MSEYRWQCDIKAGPKERGDTGNAKPEMPRPQQVPWDPERFAKHADTLNKISGGAEINNRYHQCMRAAALCLLKGMRYLQMADTFDESTRKGHKARRCMLDGCNRATRKAGMCRKHYAELQDNGVAK